MSIALHAGLLCAAGALVAPGAFVTHSAARSPTEEPDVVLRLDLRATSSADRAAARAAQVLPEAPVLARHEIPAFADQLVELDPAGATAREDALERTLALEAAASAPIASVHDAYALRDDERSSAPRAGGKSVRLPHGSGTAGAIDARAHGRPGGTGTAASGADGTGGDGPDLPPQLLAGPSPEYPATARRSGEEGDVRCRIDIDEQGNVVAVVVLHSSGSRVLDEAARTGLLAWRFRPATHGGVPCACEVEHVVAFHLIRVDSRS